jgi:DNA-binding transcriptional ArsR family regulator
LVYTARTKGAALPAKSDKEARESGLNVRLVKALGHPLRVQALQILNLRTASPNELANEMDVGVSLLSYHVRVLHELECIELVKTEPVRGAVEHFYRATSRAFFSKEDWAGVPASVRSGISGTMWGDIVPLVNAAITSGSFDSREDRHFSWTPMVVDEQGWEEAHAVIDKALPELLDIQAKSAERLAAGAEPIPIGALMACFPAAEAEPEDGPAEA